MERVLVVGAGLFGLTGARVLRERGADVTVLEAGSAPRPVSASADVSKMVRVDYGDDPLYTALARSALEAWPEWDARLGGGLFHRSGLAVLTREPLDRRPFERACLDAHAAQGSAIERLEGDAIARRIPAWTAPGWRDGYLAPDAGWVASEAALVALVALVRERGVTVREHAPVAGLLERGGRVVGVTLSSGETLEAELVLVAAGSWTPTLLPWLADRLRPLLQPVFHLLPEDPAPYSAPDLPVWVADVTSTGWYGFPALPDGRVKVGHHGAGRPVEGARPEGPPLEREGALRAFLATALPGLADAPLVGGRWCPYCDSFDADFWIGLDPERPGLAVAAGGSGHAFKYLPVIGELVADACEGRLAPTYARLGWRPLGARRLDAMRAKT